MQTIHFFINNVKVMANILSKHKNNG